MANINPPNPPFFKGGFRWWAFSKEAQVVSPFKLGSGGRSLFKGGLSGGFFQRGGAVQLTVFSLKNSVPQCLNTET